MYKVIMTLDYSCKAKSKRIAKMSLGASTLAGPNGDRMNSGSDRKSACKIAARDGMNKRDFFITLAFGPSMFGGMGGQNMARNKRVLHEWVAIIYSSFTPCVLDEASNSDFVERPNANVMKTQSRLFIPSGASSKIVRISANVSTNTNNMACRINGNYRTYVGVLDIVKLLRKNKIEDALR